MRCETMRYGIFLTAVVLVFSISVVYGQSNRLTNENGQLLWQYNQIVHLNHEKQNTVLVSFVFINGINQTAISLRQEHFKSEIEWVDTSGIQAEKDERVSFLTANLAPHQSVVWKYTVKTKPVNKELILEKSAILIMDEEFEIRKELIPEQRYAKP